MDEPPKSLPRSNWDCCAEGEIAAIQAELRHRARRRAVLRGLRVAGPVLLILIGAAVGLREMIPGGQNLPDQPAPLVQEECLDCPATLKHLPQYHANALPPETTLLVEQHLEQCPGCQKKFDQWFGSVSWLTGR